MRTIKKHAIKRMIKASGVRRALKKTTDSAVVGIVTAILLIGLVVLVISIVQTVYVPEIMEQREAEHMDMVALQFAFLTSVIDNQAADEKIGVPIATSVTLGNRELPYLVSSKAFGSLEILERSCVITINNNSLSNPVTSTFPIGRITYSSSNAYYLDQSYTYETGAMIVSQDQGNLMMVPPNFFIEYNETTNIVNITFDVVNISGIGQKVMASGYGTYPIQTEFHSVSMQRNFTDVDKLTIASSYSNSWRVFLNRSLKAVGLNSAGYGTHFLLNDTGTAVTLDFLSNGILPTVTINFRIIEIRGQIGPGWVE
ncbi:hypothetical protein AYK25_06355 [Thermoplasmatales archaeon SM1-50]|nr:MAG: hypothetical protein AYK25_06355 [Thermoplasmatales archaeon SM1-50]